MNLKLPLLPDLAQIKNLVITGFVAIVIGFGGGYYTKGQFDHADQLAAAQAVIKDAAQEVVKSEQASQRIETKVATSNAAVSQIRKQVASRLSHQEKSHEVQSHPASDTTPTQPDTGCVYSDWSLDAGTVGLLNAARTGTDSPAVSDAEGQAPSGVTGADLIDNDLEVVEMYRELAIRHDELVDYVQSLVNKQADK